MRTLDMRILVSIATRDILFLYSKRVMELQQVMASPPDSDPASNPASNPAPISSSDPSSSSPPQDTPLSPPGAAGLGLSRKAFLSDFEMYDIPVLEAETTSPSPSAHSSAPSLTHLTLGLGRGPIPGTSFSTSSTPTNSPHSVGDLDLGDFTFEAEESAASLAAELEEALLRSEASEADAGAGAGAGPWLGAKKGLRIDPALVPELPPFHCLHFKIETTDTQVDLINN